MGRFGWVECSDCGSPLDADSSVCPYCYSSRLHSELYQTDALGVGWWVFGHATVGLITVGVLLASDTWFGTSLLPALLATVDRWLN
jgi:hypothetical protein